MKITSTALQKIEQNPLILIGRRIPVVKTKLPAKTVSLLNAGDATPSNLQKLPILGKFSTNRGKYETLLKEASSLQKATTSYHAFLKALPLLECLISLEELPEMKPAREYPWLKTFLWSVLPTCVLFALESISRVEEDIRKFLAPVTDDMTVNVWIEMPTSKWGTLKHMESVIFQKYRVQCVIFVKNEQKGLVRGLLRDIKKFSDIMEDLENLPVSIDTDVACYMKEEGLLDFINMEKEYDVKINYPKKWTAATTDSHTILRVFGERDQAKKAIEKIEIFTLPPGVQINRSQVKEVPQKEQKRSSDLYTSENMNTNENRRRRKGGREDRTSNYMWYQDII
ncbi:hypothetical protein SK128_017175 [Halocaridina rubra]|uniref:Uncharacterized protein n=1 Tax=Halocaridina rubra TaxID=373956 RepID=A0AAN8ZZE1_HALRR